MRLNFYSNVENVGLIKKVIADIYNDPTMSLNVGNLKSSITAYVNPADASPLDAYQFVEEFDDNFE